MGSVLLKWEGNHMEEAAELPWEWRHPDKQGLAGEKQTEGEEGHELGVRDRQRTVVEGAVEETKLKEALNAKLKCQQYITSC